MKSIALLLTLIFFLSACSSNNRYLITNVSDHDITDKTIVLSRKVVMEHLKDTSLMDGFFARSESGEWLPTQFDDLDGDGNWDEMAFLCNLTGGTSLKVSFEKPDSALRFPKRTNVRFGRMTKPFDEVTSDLRMKTNDTKFTAPVYQMEGPAWENDLIAFRNYYDARNGIDIFGKTTKEMVLDSVGVNGRDYHTLADWGMDILKVGNSLGAGAIALAIGDSLYRIGPCEEGTYRLISEGPVRSILELDYKNVPAANRVYHVKHRIILNAGERFYRNLVWIFGTRGDESLVTGIVNLHNIQPDTMVVPKGKVLYSLGNQGYNGELLGMAIILPDSQLIRFDEAPVEGSGIVNTHLVRIKLFNNEPSLYNFFAVWENESPLIKDPCYFTGLLNEAADK